MLNALYSKLQSEGTGNGPLSAKTVRYIHTTVHRALEDAVDSGVLAKNTAERAEAAAACSAVNWQVRIVGVARAGTVPGVVKDARLAGRLATRRDDRHAVAGEILGLRWRHGDLDAARLSVRQAVMAVEYEVIESTPKSHTARVIDLDGETVGLLRAHKQQQRAERLEWGADYGDRDLVPTRENGSPIHPHSFSQMFTQLVNRAGIRPIRLRDLRHTHATLALNAGAPIKVVSERLDHESPAFTLKQYAHVIPGMQAAAAALVAELIGEHKAPARDAA